MRLAASLPSVSMDPDGLRGAEERGKHVPLFLDVHDGLPAGETAGDVAAAHAADLKIQGQHGVRYETYWIDLRAGKFFCLVEAPSAEAANKVHRESHGLVADQLYEVQQGP